MSLANFMLPQVASDGVRLSELAHCAPPSALFAGFDPGHSELLIDGVFSTNVGELTPKNLATNYKAHRNLQFIESLPSTPVRSILWDMEDARAFDSRVYTGKDLNIFQYNRRVGSSYAVLWRLRNYFEPSRGVGHGGWVEDLLQFQDKRAVVYWRGAVAGSRWVDPFERVGALTVRNSAEFEAMADHFSRIKAGLLSRTSTAFDLKLTGPGRLLDSKPWLEDLGVFDDIVRPVEQLENKYILCLNGNDVASNLYWVLSSQSIAFKEDCAYEVLPDYFLKPWVHYVPIAKGLTDLQEKFDYCEANPTICRKIIENANAAYSEIIDEKAWNAAEVEVLERLRLI